MTSEVAGVASESPGGIFSKISGQTPASSRSIQDPEGHFRQEWSAIAEEMDASSKSVDIDERLRPDSFKQALDLSFRYPEFVEVSSNPVDEEVPSMFDHVQSHFDVAFNDDLFAPTFSVPTRSNFQTLLRACEIVYIDDAVLRFVPRWIFEPDFGDLNILQMNGFPNQLDEWMEQAQLMWSALGGVVELTENQVEGLIQTLYGSRTNFVETAMEMDMFLPVPPKDFDPESSDSLWTRFNRYNELSPAHIHNYCYKQVLDQY